MSEYQYYEFVAVDRPLDAKQSAEVRAMSTRAQITPTSFVNTYEWGNFHGSPARMMERYYDGFLYLANWAPGNSCSACRPGCCQPRLPSSTC